MGRKLRTRTILYESVLLRCLNVSLPINGILVSLIRVLAHATRQPVVLIIPVLGLCPIGITAIRRDRLLLCRSVRLFQDVGDNGRAVA